MFTINYCPTEYAAKQPDCLDKFLAILEDYALDRMFERYGNFVYERADDGITRFWGNFFDLSYVFSIDTDEPDKIELLTTAIRANQQRPDYLAQDEPYEAERLRIAARDKAEAECRAKKAEQLRRELAAATA